MKKKALVALVAVFVLVATACVFVACQPNEPTTKYTVNFDAGFDGGVAPQSVTKTQGETVTLPNAPERDGNWEFLGWYDGDVKYEQGTEYTVSKNVTLVAKWRDTTPAPKIEVKFSAGYEGAESIQSIFADENQTITLPDAPERDGNWEFTGWQIDGDTQLYDANAQYPVTEEVTFVAQWRDTTPTDLIPQEYRGDWVTGDEWSSGILGIEECYHIEANTIYYQGLEVTDLQRRAEGGLRFVAHAYEVFGKADAETKPDELVTGDDGFQYEVWRLSFVAEMFFNDEGQLVVYAHQPEDEPDYSDEPDILTKVENFTLQFSANANSDPVFLYPGAENGYEPGPAPEVSSDAFLGWYSDAGMSVQWLPGKEYDPAAKYYQNMYFSALYVYNAKFTNPETGDYFYLETDSDGNYMMFNGVQVGIAEYSSAEKTVYVYDYNGKLTNVYKVDTENFTFEDITPEPVDGSAFAGNWYGLFFDGSYYRFDIDAEGNYTVTTWLPGRKAVKGESKKYTVNIESQINLVVENHQVYGTLNDNGTLALEIQISRSDVQNALLVKVGTVVGTWSALNTTATFDADGNISIGGENGTYTGENGTYSATVGTETLTITVSEYGEMTIASDNVASVCTGAYMPGENPYTRPQIQYDAAKGQFYGYFDEDWCFRFDFDGLGSVAVCYWDISPDNPTKPQTYAYVIDGVDLSFNAFSVNFIGELSNDGKVMKLTDRATKKIYVLVTQDAILGSHTYQEVTYTFADGQVMIGDDTVEYAFHCPKLNEEYAAWTASVGEIDYTFSFGEDGFEVEIVDNSAPTPQITEDMYYGTWTVNDGDGDYEIIIHADGSGNASYVGEIWDYDDFDQAISWTYDETEHKITFSADGSTFYMQFEGDKCYLTRGSSKIGAMTKTAEEQKQVTPESDYVGIWEGSDDEGDYTLTLNAAHTGSYYYEDTYFGDDYSFDFTWSYNVADGSISIAGSNPDNISLQNGTITYMGVDFTKTSTPTPTPTPDPDPNPDDDSPESKFYGTFSYNDGDGDYTIVINKGGTGNASYEADFDFYDDFDESITWTYDAEKDSVSFSANSMEFTITFQDGSFYLTVGENPFDDPMTKK